MRLIVHAGPGKTGSTAIQKTLLKASQALQAQGILYLGLMFERSPELVYPWQRPGGFDAFHRLPKPQASLELKDVLNRTLSAAESMGATLLVLSNESLLRRNDVFLEVLDGLRDAGVDISAIAYARRYGELAKSAYAQWGLSHKTYRGPLKSFRAWISGREMQISPSVREWKSRLGNDFQLRNFDACDDVVKDFLEAAGLPADIETLRAQQALSANELAFRALFNSRHDEPVPPVRFTKLFRAHSLNFNRPLGDWLRSLVPTEQELAEFDKSLDHEYQAINDILGQAGQPLLAREPTPSKPPELDLEAMLATLFEMVSDHALRIESLEAPESESPIAKAAPGMSGNMMPATPLDAVRELAPSLGYFGATIHDQLQVALPGPVSEIRLSLAEDSPTFLNLRSLKLARSGKSLNLAPDDYVASQSSRSGNKPVGNSAAGLLASTGIHSAAELAPWWSVKFHHPVDADMLWLCNRSDGWGCRSRTLKIEIIDSHGQYHCLYHGQSVASLKAVLDGASKAASIPVTALPQTVQASRALRDRLLRAIAGRILLGEQTLEGIDWRAVVPLLDVWSAQEATDDSWTVIAAFLLAQQRSKGGTSIKAFSLFLNSVSRLERLQDEINRIAKVIGAGDYMLTRHGIKPSGVLRKERDRFIDHLSDVTAVLSDHGYAPVLAYGTLLGAARDGDFIGHDDDIDILYLSPETSRDGVEAEQARLQVLFRDQGFRVVSLLPNSLNLHVINKKNGAVMDVFPCWREEGKLHMHMESMRVRGIDEGIIYPAASIELCGKSFPAPADVPGYLQERYGEDWQVSNQFFEWPWPLKDEEAQ